MFAMEMEKILISQKKLQRWHLVGGGREGDPREIREGSWLSKVETPPSKEINKLSKENPLFDLLQEQPLSLVIKLRTSMMGTQFFILPFSKTYPCWPHRRGRPNCRESSRKAFHS
jgi:hypothetical protein